LASQKLDPAIIRRMHADGKRPCEIRRELNCSEVTVFRALRDRSNGHDHQA
jgi:hypothetical protein